MNKNIGIIAIFYNPTEECVSHFIKFARAGFYVAIGNNGIKDQYLKKMEIESNMYILGEGVNIGLAAALNKCINFFIDSINVRSVILFDQDSKPKIELPIELEKSFKLLRSNANPACVGPYLIDRKMTGKSSLLNAERFMNVETIATSGTYISTDVLRMVGLMKEELFIDCIDHEWCFRASSLGYEIYVDLKNTMSHDMGESGMNFFGSYKPIYKSPVRHYYIVRNCIYMLGLNYVPFWWRFKECFKLIRRILFYLIFSNRRIATLINVFRAVFHGLSGKLGAIK